LNCQKKVNIENKRKRKYTFSCFCNVLIVLFLGKLIAEKGSHEAIIFHTIEAEGTTHEDLEKLVGESMKVGLSKALKNKWIAVVKSGNAKLYIRRVETIIDEVRRIQIRG